MIAVTPLLRLAASGQNTGGLETLGLKPGETVTAKVLELLPGGSVRIAVAGQELLVASNALLKPGAELALRAEREGQLLKLVLLGSSEGKPSTTPVTASPARPATTAPADAVIRQAQATLLRELDAGVPQAAASRTATAAASTPGILQRLPHYAAVQASIAGPGSGLPELTGQQRAVLSSVASGLAEIVAGANRQLPDALRQTAARLLGLPVADAVPAQLPAAAASQASALVKAPQSVSRDAVAALFTSLANVIAHGAGLPQATIQQVAARLLDLTVPAPTGDRQAALLNTDKTLLAATAALFDVAARLASSPQRLPQGVRDALERLFGLRLPLAQATSTTGLQSGVKASGLLHETLLAQALPGTPTAPDLKSALLVLRAALHNWVGTQQAAPGSSARLLQPRPGFNERPVELQSLARTLLQQSEVHLARLRLAQFAATPDRAEAGSPARADTPEISGQIPLADGARTALIQFQIEREAAPPEGEERRAWNVRFSFDFEATGYTHTLIVLRGNRVRVRFRTERRETLSLFNAHETLLRALLEEAELEVSDIAVALIAPRPEGEGQHVHVDQLT